MQTQIALVINTLGIMQMKVSKTLHQLRSRDLFPCFRTRREKAQGSAFPTLPPSEEKGPGNNVKITLITSERKNVLRSFLPILSSPSCWLRL